MLPPRLRTALFTLSVFAVALVARLYDIRGGAPLTDERLWVNRSSGVIVRLHEKPLNSTTHLGHPGVPPALVMAWGHLAADAVRDRLDPRTGSLVTPLTACRTAVAAATSLTAPIVFAGMRGFIGAPAAFGAAVLVALDPHLLGNGRMAHLDALLALFVTATFLAYAHAIRRNRESFGGKILAGCCWGLAVATKPTAGILILGMLLYRILIRLRGRPIPILTWGDIAAVGAGHAVLGALYTRLWWHQSEYMVRLGIRTRAAKFFYTTGSALHARPALSLVIVLALGAFSYFNHRRACRPVEGSRIVPAAHLQLRNGGIFLTIFTGSLALVPQVFENFARYWTWAAGLSRTELTSFVSNRHLDPAPYGYWGLMLSHLSPIVLAGLVPATFVIGRSLVDRKRPRDGATVCLAMMATTLMWLLFLQSSSKQSWRYLLPVVPFLIVVSAYGSWTVLRPLKARARVAVFGMIVAAGAMAPVGWGPNYFFYRNFVSGGLPAALARGELIPNFAPRELFEFIRAGDLKRGILTLATAEDAAIIKLGLEHFNPDRHRTVLAGAFRPVNADYAMTYFHRGTDSPPGERVFTYRLGGADLLALTVAPPAALENPLELPFDARFTKTGLNPSVGRRGHLNSSIVRVDPGRFIVQATVELTAPADLDLPVISLGLASGCKRQFLVRDIPSSGELAMECQGGKLGVLRPTVYWEGRVAMRLRRIAVSRSVAN